MITYEDALPLAGGSAATQEQAAVRHRARLETQTETWYASYDLAHQSANTALFNDLGLSSSVTIADGAPRRAQPRARRGQARSSGRLTILRKKALRVKTGGPARRKAGNVRRSVFTAASAMSLASQVPRQTWGPSP